MILSLDLGTSTFKAAVFAYDGACVSQASVPLNITGGGLRYEVDPAVWLRAMETALPRLRGVAGVEALAVSGNGPTLVPVTGTPGLDSTGLSVPGGAARLWLDRRAQGESRRVSALAGAYVDPSFFLPKALWIKNQEPRLYGETRFFLSAPEYLLYALTGEARTVLPAPGFERWYWTGELLDRAGLDRAKFPPFAAPGELIGTLSPQAAAFLGFSRPIKVLAGGPDFFVAILGSGAVRPGRACDRGGTSEGINLCTENQITDSRLMSYGHPVKPFWNLSGIISTSGKAIAWIRDILGMTALPYSAFYELASRSEPGAGGVVFLPYLAGERAPHWNPHARGVFQGLNLSTGRAELARAVAEGVCFAIRDVITVMKETGAPVEDLRVTGGPGESAFLNQLKADITGLPVLLPACPEAELLGLAALAAASLGKYAGPEEAAGVLAGIRETRRPQSALDPLYQDRFEKYRELYPLLKPQFGDPAV